MAASTWVARAARTFVAAIAGLLLAGAAGAQVTVNQILFPSNIGRTLDATVTIDVTRTSAAAAVVTTPIPSQLGVNPPAPPAGCTVVAGAVECTVPAGGPGDIFSLSFQVRGATLGAFGLTATGTGGSSASNTGSVRSSGELTVLKTKNPAGNVLAGQSTSFTLQAQLGVDADDLPHGATLVLLDQLPGTVTDFQVTDITSGIASCTSVGNANSSREVTCTFTGPLTAAQVNAASVVITGTPLTSGNFVNVASVTADQSVYFDRNLNNNTANVPYTVDPASDVQAQGSFPATPVAVGTAQTLTLTYRNNGPSNLPAGGTVSTVIPAGFTVSSLPTGCTGPATGVVLLANATLTCTAGAVLNGSAQDFVIPLVMPATPTSGNFTVTVTTPGGFGDAVAANNTVNLPYAVAEPYADLRLTKAKSPGSGPVAAGTVITTTLTITNDANSTTAASFSPAQPLRVVDWMRPEETAGGALSAVSAGWSCSVSDNPDPSDAMRTKRVLCVSTTTGTLAVGASAAVSFSTTVGAVVGQVTLANRACSGETVLSTLGLSAGDGPQPAGNSSTANDCASAGSNLIGTDVVSGSAVVSVVKESSTDNVAFFDPVASAPTLAADGGPQFWRITITTGGGNATIPTLALSDVLPGILNVSSPGAPATSFVTPEITVNLIGAAAASCPATIAAGSNALNCSFSNVPAGSIIVITYEVQPPFSGGTLTNTATLSSPNAILTGTTSDSAAIVVAPHTDVAATTKVVTPTTPRVGQTVQFTVTAQNLGPDDVSAAGDFKIIDDLNTSTAGATVAFGDIAASSTGMSCALANTALADEPALAANHTRVRCVATGSVPRYSTRTIVITGRVLKPATLPASGTVYTGQTNTARVDIPDSTCEFKTETTSNGSTSAACNDAASTSNNTRTVTFDVLVPQIDLQQRKTRVLPSGQASFGVGQPLRYRFRIQNNGPSRAENVVMTDQLTVPAGFSLASAAVANVNAVAAESGYTLDASKTATLSCTQAAANADVVCRLSATLADNFLDAAREVNFEIELAQTGTSVAPVSFRNEALVCADETVTHESAGACDRAAANNNNLAAVNDVIFPRADLALAKTTLTAMPAGVNQPIQFRLVARNLGPQSTQQIRVIDTLPANFELVTSGPNAPSLALGSFVTQAPSTATGATLACTAVPASITAVGQQQVVTCVINATPGPLGVGALPGSSDAANTLTVTLAARAKDGFFSGPYLTNITNSASVSPGLDGSGNELSIDTVPGNNSATSTVQITRSSLAGRVFNDRNGNGLQNGTDAAQDEGIGSVTLTLTGTDASGSAVTRTTTSNNTAGATRGDYLFDDLPPGTYVVTETQPGSFVNGAGSPAAASAGGSYTAAASGTTSTWTSITLGAGVAATGYNFPESLPPGAITGTVFIDRDNNGLFGPGDAPLPGITLKLYPAGTTCPATGALPAGDLQTVTTLNDGSYTFTNVTSGNSYVICQEQPAGYGDSAPRPGNDASTPRVNQIDVTNLPEGGSSANNFPELLARVSGLVFLDYNVATPGSNGNGVSNAGEPGLGSGTAGAGVPVTLTGTRSAGPNAGLAITPITVFTAADGSYAFADLFPGTYTVTQGSVPAALGSVADGINTAGTVTSGTAGTAGAVGDNAIRSIVLNGAAQSPNNNFAKLPNASITGTVYLDRDRDGALSAADPGRLAGVVIELRSGGSSCANATLIGSTTTGVDGSFSFPGGNVSAAQVAVGPGYRVCQLQPAAYSDGSTTSGTNASSPVANEILITALPLTGSLNNLFGEVGARVLGSVYLDRDHNGVFAGADSAIAGVTVTLSGSAIAAPVVGTSAADGSFVFDDLPAGSYTLTEQSAQPVVTVSGNPVTTLNGRTTPGSFATVASAITTTPSSIGPITLAAGAVSPGHLFGEILPASISGRVWSDANDNGVIDGGGSPESGIPGVTITLTGNDENGTVTASTSTDADGRWRFDGLRPGTYTVTEPTQPAGTTNGKTLAGTIGGASSGTATAQNVTPSAVAGIVLGLGAASVDNNFGEIPSTAILGGRVWLDRNDNGRIDAGEPGLAGVTVTLSGTVSRTTTTDADGRYAFAALPPGTYTVTEPTQPADTFNGRTVPGTAGGTATNVFTTPSAISTIALGVGQSSTENNFGELPPGSIAGRVWMDANDNGVIDSGEAPIPGVTVLLDGSDGTGAPVSRSTTTDADGRYRFDGLRAGTYTVTEPTQPAGTSNGLTLPGSSGGEATARTLTPSAISALRLGVGAASVDNNFAEVPASGTISGRVWNDRNGNGVIDAGEPGIPGMTITLAGPVARTATTDADGRYAFTALPPGSYTVTEPSQPAGTLNGRTVAGPLGGSATGLATTPSAVSGIVLQPGQSAPENNFGEVTTSSLAGRVWNDTNDNAAIDGTETGIPGVSITLSGVDDTGAAISRSTTTGTDGSYRFDGLRPGTYTVAEPNQPVNTSNGKTVPGSTGGTATPQATTPSAISAITLPGGTASVQNNFGEVPSTGVIAGRVWLDRDHDGTVDTGEPGIPGVLIELIRTELPGNPVVRSSTTGPDGRYVFDGLPPGTYAVREPTQPAGTLDGRTVPGPAGGSASAPGTLPSRISDIVLGVGQLAPENNFGELPPARLAGTVWTDGNDNGRIDGNEAGIPGITVNLSGTDDTGARVTRSTSAGPDGRYSFDDLRPGTYTVTEPDQPVNTTNGKTVPGSTGGNATPPATVPSAIAAIPLAPGATSSNNNFGELPNTARISGIVFIDGNDDGVPQAAEPGIPGITITLTGRDIHGNPVDRTTTTGPDGRYVFDGLPPGVYTVTEPTQPPGTLNGRTTPGPVGGTPTAVATTPSAIVGIVLTRGLEAPDNRFAELQPARLTGRVWLDGNDNGRIDGTEPGIPGVRVALSGTDSSGSPVSRETTTGPDGGYAFDGLRPGTYTVTEPNQPVNTTNGKTSPGSTGGNATTPATTPSAIATIPLAPGVTSSDNNFGELPNTARISGIVFIDGNDDGVPQSGEPGIAGVRVTLVGRDTNDNPVERSTVTDADGRYVFDGLPPGIYTVTEPTQPPGTLNGRTTPGPVGGTPTVVAAAPSAIVGIVLTPGLDSPDNRFAELQPARLTGRVWLDGNDNGVIDGNEPGIPGVRITLAGTDTAGQPVAREATTDADGGYIFDGLRPGTYTVTEPSQPPSTINGKTMPGSTGGTATPQTTTPSAIASIPLSPGQTSSNNNFAELGLVPDLAVSKRALQDVFTVRRNGQYRISVRNAGTGPTSGSYTVTDRLPAGLTLVGTPSGNGWSCTGTAGANGFSCSSSTVLAAGAVHPATIEFSVAVAASALQAQGQAVSNAVMVEGGGEPPNLGPTPAERDAVNNPTTNQPPNLPACAEGTANNACRSVTTVQNDAAISGNVWLELGPRVRELDSGDRRLPGWRVEVIDPGTGTVLGTALTDAQGHWRIDQLEPGVPLVVRFREPGTGIVYGWPVNGDTGTPAAPCSTSQRPSSCADRGIAPQLRVTLAPGQELTQQSLPVDPSGVVYDAVTREPVRGATVTFAPATGTSCPAWDPRTMLAGATLGGYTVNGGSISMVTDSSGFYQYLLLANAPTRCTFTLTVTPPAGYTAPSALIPVQPGTLANPGDPGTVVRVQPQPTAPAVGAATPYWFKLEVGSGTPDVVHNHIPLDPGVAAGVSLRKTVDRAVAELGDTLRYSIAIRVGAGIGPRQMTVVDRLPAGFAFITGSALLDGRRIADPVRGPSGAWIFQLGSLAANASVTLQYRVRIGVGAAEGDGINRATGFGCELTTSCLVPGTLNPLPQAKPSNESQARVRVQGGVFGGEACLAGKVFVDCNGNHVQDREELGIPGVRLVMQDGTTLNTDSEGKYSVCGLPPKSHVIRVDESTLPRGSRLTTSSNRNLGDAGSLWLDIQRGSLHRGDFVEGSCSNRVLDQVKARRAQGEVRSPETERASQGTRPALRFDSKAHGLNDNRTPQQGTESGTQAAPRPRPPDSAGSAAGASTGGRP